MQPTNKKLALCVLSSLLAACASQPSHPSPDVGLAVAVPCPAPPPRPNLPPVPSYSFQTRLQEIFDGSLPTPTTSPTHTVDASKQ